MLGGGAGHIADMISRLKMNKAQRRGRTPYLGNREALQRYSIKRGLEFRKASPEEMAALKAEIHRDRTIAVRNTWLAAIVSVVLTVALVIVVFGI